MEQYKFIGEGEVGAGIKPGDKFFLEIHYRDDEFDILATVYQKVNFNNFCEVASFRYGSMQQFGYNWKKV